MTGTLVLVVGPSGSGKDTLIAGARAARQLRSAFRFPQREITRPNAPSAETHIVVTPSQFRDRRQAGHYSLAWDAHDCLYGIPRRMEDDLAAGRHVVVNVSRGVIAAARHRFPDLAIVSVTVPIEVLRQRLDMRGRESAAAIETRLARSAAFTVAGPEVLAFDNGRPKSVAIPAFVDLLRGVTKRKESVRSA